MDGKQEASMATSRTISFSLDGRTLRQVEAFRRQQAQQVWLTRSTVLRMLIGAGLAQLFTEAEESADRDRIEGE